MVRETIWELVPIDEWQQYQFRTGSSRYSSTISWTLAIPLEDLYQYHLLNGDHLRTGDSTPWWMVTSYHWGGLVTYSHPHTHTHTHISSCATSDTIIIHSKHPYAFTPTHPHTLTPTHPHLHTFTPSHHHILTPSHPHTITHHTPSCAASDPSPIGTSSFDSPPTQSVSSHTHHSYPTQQNSYSMMLNV